MGIFKKIFRAITKPFEKIFKAIVSAITSPFGMNIDVPDYDIGTDQTAAIQGVLVNKDSAVVSIPIVYGTRRVGGTRVFVSTNGTDNKYLYVAMILSEGPVNGYTSLLIDDNTVPLDSYAHGVQSNASSGSKYRDRLLVQFFDGRDDQVASTLLKEAPGWTDNHTLSGLAYIAYRVEWRKPTTQAEADNNPYTGGIPNIKVTLQGKKIFDMVAGYSPADYGSITGQTGTVSGNFSSTNTASSMYKTFTGLTATNAVTDNDITFTLTNTADVRVEITQTISSTDTASKGVQANNGFNLTTAAEGFISGGGISYNTSIGGSVSNKTSTYSNIFTLTAGDYKIDFTSSSAPYGGCVYTETLYKNIQIIIPEVEDHTVLYENETVSFNNNPVNVVADYMRNPRYGKGLANAAFNWISWRQAALLCDQTVTYTNATTSKAFTTDAVVDTDQSLMNNCKILLANFRCMMPYTGGQYKLQIEHGGDNTDITATPDNPAVAFTVTNDHMLGGLQLQGESKEYKCNRCVVTYVDPEADYEPNDVMWPEEGSATDNTYLGQDGVRLEKRITLPALSNRKIAEQYAQVFVKRSRNQKSIAFSTTMATSNTTVGDLIRVIDSYIGLDGIFRITDIGITTSGTVEFEAIEHQSSAFAIAGSGSDYTRPTLSLPDPDVVLAPTLLTLSSGAAYNLTTNTQGYLVQDSTVRRLSVDWTASTDTAVDSYLVQWKASASGTWTDAGTTVAPTLLIPGVAVGTAYDARVATVTQLGRRSDWLTVTNHTVTV